MAPLFRRDVSSAYYYSTGLAFDRTEDFVPVSFLHIKILLTCGHNFNAIMIRSHFASYFQIVHIWSFHSSAMKPGQTRPNELRGLDGGGAVIPRVLGLGDEGPGCGGVLEIRGIESGEERPVGNRRGCIGDPSLWPRTMLYGRVSGGLLGSPASRSLEPPALGSWRWDSPTLRLPDSDNIY